MTQACFPASYFLDEFYKKKFIFFQSGLSAGVKKLQQKKEPELFRIGFLLGINEQLNGNRQFLRN